MPSKSHRVSEPVVLEIIRQWNAGTSQVEIAKSQSVTQPLVSQIVNRKIHTEITKAVWIRGHTAPDTAEVEVVYNPK